MSASTSSSTTETLNIKEFDITNIEPSSSWLILGPPGVGKSSFIEELVILNRHKYPLCRIICNPPPPHRRYCEIFPPSMVFQDFVLKREEEFIRQQKNKVARMAPDRFIVYIHDDSDESKRHSFYTTLFKQGSRHWCMLTIVADQNALEFPPAIRSSASYVVIFRYSSCEQRKKIYNSYGGASVFRSERLFNQLMDVFLDKKFQCLVIKQNAYTNNIEDCVFYYHTGKVKKDASWRFNGCRELQEHNKRRLDKSKAFG